MKQLILGVVALIVVVFAAGPVLAGGWAVTTLDSVPAATAGQTVEIGFTIRQHGVTPVDPGGEVGIVLRSMGGEERFFAAESAGEVGHYVVELTFPDDGTWSWAVRQGWFAEQALGTVELGPSSDSAAAGGYGWPGWIRVGLPALALALGVGAALDATRNRPWRQRIGAT